MAIGIRQARALEHIQTVSLETIRALMVALDARDPYTAGHSQRVAEYTLAIAERIGHDEEQRQILEYAALLHDIGKVGCDERAWRKPGKLDDGEAAEMRKHVFIAGQIFKAIRFLAPAASWAYHHHERWDGRGYPDGLKEEDIPLPARILLVADAYDAMTSNRPYRASMKWTEAIAELEKNSGSQFDPVIVKVWVELVRQKELPNQTDCGMRPCAGETL
jgi:putative nucleotidyltransferase with HDIG domain